MIFSNLQFQELAPIYQARPETAPATLDPSVYHVALLVRNIMIKLIWYYSCFKVFGSMTKSFYSIIGPLFLSYRSPGKSIIIILLWHNSSTKSLVFDQIILVNHGPFGLSCRSPGKNTIIILVWYYSCFKVFVSFTKSFLSTIDPSVYHVALLVKQACKSSEDKHFTGYAQFEKVWAM